MFVPSDIYSKLVHTLSALGTEPIPDQDQVFLATFQRYDTPSREGGHVTPMVLDHLSCTKLGQVLLKVLPRLFGINSEKIPMKSDNSHFTNLMTAAIIR